MENELTADIENDIIIANIKWWKKNEDQSKVKYYDLPESYQISIPNNMLMQYQNDYSAFKDNIETFVYGFLTKKFGFEVTYCQIWLPV